MKPRTFAQVVSDCAYNHVEIEQIAMRSIVLHLGCLRWCLVLKSDGLWHQSDFKAKL